MSYIYGRRYNNFHYNKNITNSNKKNNLIGEIFNPYQPKTANMNNQHSYYSTINSIRRKPSNQKIDYNKPTNNYGNFLTTKKYNSVRKNGNGNGNAPLFSNSYNIINNFNKIRDSKTNLTFYNKRFSTKKDVNIKNIFNNENKKRERAQFYFSDRKKIYNNDYKQNENNLEKNNYQYNTQYNQIKTNKPTTAPIEPLINNNIINSVIKSLESDTKKNDKIIQENSNIYKNDINNNNNNKYDNNNKNNKHDEKMSDINLSEYYKDNCSLVLNYAYKEDQNSKYRDYMEDKGRAIENLNDDENNILFCLFDGHGGGEVSTYLQNNFAKHMKNNYPFTPNEKKYFFSELFRTIDQKLKELNYYEVGSTAIIVYITKENNKKYIYCINIGDSRCVLIKTNEYKRLSYDDRASDKNESDRIIKNGGIIIDERVYGQLMLSRAFGDWELKQYGVSNEPHVNKIEIENDDLFIVMASDGVWDVLDDSEVYKMSLLAINSKDFCNNIIKSAKEKGSLDNISCFVIQLN